MSALSDPYVLLIIAGAIASVGGWLASTFLWPALVEAAQRFIKANMVAVVQPLVNAAKADNDARIDAFRHETSERFNTIEERYDDEINDLRDAWSRRHEP